MSNGNTIKKEEFTEDSEVKSIITNLKKKNKMKNKKYSNIVDNNGNQYVDLVMEGGGVLGIALVGYTYLLEKMGIRFLSVGGTSAGSINALMLGAMDTPQNIKSEKMIDVLANLDMFKLVDGNDDIKGFIKAYVQDAGRLKKAFTISKLWNDIDDIYKNIGLNPGKYFYDWLTENINKVNIKTTKNLKDRMLSIPDEIKTVDHRPVGARLAVVSADITTETKVEFPRMARLYFPDPDSVNPAKYIRASMSIPFFFYPLEIKRIPKGPKAKTYWDDDAGYNEAIPSKCLFVDGGVMSNFPIDLFHIPNIVPRCPTFGAKLGQDQRLKKKIDNPLDFFGAVFNSARHTLDYDFIKRNPDYKNLVTWIETGKHNWLNFFMNKKDKIDLFKLGVKAAADFLEGFDWEDYQNIRKKIAAMHQ
jgi:NTE family protein